jgi:hypothetical protein
LPYLYRCLILQGLGPAVKILCDQLISNPALGSSIRRLYLPVYTIFREDHMSSILSCADRLEVVKGLRFGSTRDPRQYSHDLDQPEVTGQINSFSFSVLAHTSGATLRTLSTGLNSSSVVLPIALPSTLFSSFKVLRSLELWAANVKFEVGHARDLKDALPTLEHLRLEACDPSLLQVLTCME